jgi:tetratricopeptide (TPR) repeat protein
MKRFALLALLLAACASPLDRGESLYQHGDLRGALDTWREVPETSPDYPAATMRLETVGADLDKLVARHLKQAGFFEDKGRLAESILSYRLALELRPDDRDTLGRVQTLSRTLAKQKRSHRESFDRAFEDGNLARAHREMARLQKLDPFDAERAAPERSLDDAVSQEVGRRVREGRRLFREGDLAGAEASFRAALAVEPTHESARGHLAYIETIRDIESHARREGSAVPPPALQAGDAEIRAEGFYRNALAAERSGDPYTALRYDQAAVDTDPGHRAAREHMAKLRRRLAPRVEGLLESGRVAFGEEDLRGALERWRRALLIDPENERAQEYTARAEHLLANLERLRDEPGVSAGTR